ncbi:enoyl-CoA hydratase/isomerase family protein [Sphingomonas psychrotolerans]|uniref:3-hydroxyisobutyryl-CoA hydrolase n=1 Tax=Sphingomonas psychrotolerans TaxID=1327635 RepID=A0ABU3N2U6_9SPHN|nr:enoyl-CoA hydratase/isomerase family protein [Sphingomonas psychrotolerans]MDT8758723.1 enoyl-CoA hydratase/isomerase family protein [Sphingomonas psychrotolerans]
MSDVLISTEGRVGRIRLNRPKALHALNTGMCAAMLDALTTWRSDNNVEAVLIDHAEGRGFCAGGDIRMIAESGASDGAAARDFFRVEYQLNHALFTYAKPVAAFMDGITMGGGVGISQPAKFRVATENTRFAMPETGIGLFPDVGGGWYLSRLPGHLGEYIALTGARLNGADCLALGLASHFVAADRLEDAKARIVADPQAIPATLDALSEPPGEAATLEHRAEIDRLFAADTLEEILAALAADAGLWAKEQLAILATKSPQAMKVSLQLVRQGRHMPSFEDEMRQEFAVATRVVQRPDFAEGVRAVIVDKDNAPRWQPATVEGVTDHVIDQIFAPLPPGDEWAPA